MGCPVRATDIYSRLSSILPKHTTDRWFGYVCRMPRGNIDSQTFKHYYKGQRKRGRPLKRWRDQTRDDTGLPLFKAERYTVNRAGLDNFPDESEGRYDTYKSCKSSHQEQINLSDPYEAWASGRGGGGGRVGGMCPLSEFDLCTA